MNWKKLVSPERIRFVRFCCVGASGVLVNLAGVWMLQKELLVDVIAAEDTFLGASTLFAVSTLGGIVLSVFTNFLLNDFWTWGDREKRGHSDFWRRLAKFYLVSSVAGSVQWGVSVVAHASFGMAETLAILLGIGVGTGINYVANNTWTFRVPKDSGSR